MEISTKILSDITVHMKYARYMPELNRRENWDELVDRNKDMHVKRYPDLSEEIANAYKYVYDKKVLPSMRSMQFAGKPVEISPNRIYNCAYMPIDNLAAFNEAMFLLLGGTGVGYSVQRHHVNKLPEVRKPNPKNSKRYLIGDSIEGWADAIKILVKNYFYGGPTIRFDFSAIRSKGAILKTSGGKAPGPQPLKECLLKIEGILTNKADGDRLRPIEVHDMMCHIADAVLAGGIRRAAMISLFSADDDEMLSCKVGTWYELNPQRGRANNSVVLLRHRINREFYNNLWDRVRLSGSGEPGFYFTNDKDWGTNPCCEIALRPYQFCNLVEINASNLESEEDYFARCKAASFIGTLQAGYTDFHYLRDEWRQTTEKEALIGVSMTGIASDVVLGFNMGEGSRIVKQENRRVATLLNINPAARTTCVKPAGTTSLTLGTSSGIHAWHAPYYIRRIRVGKNESIYTYLVKNHPEMVEDDYFNPSTQAVISAPQKSPDNAIYRTESPLQLLKRVKRISEEWVRGGHREGQNTHNVSATISIKENEWVDVGEWMWKHRGSYNGLSVFPFSENNHTHKQLPFEDCSKETYEALLKNLTSINLDLVTEEEDNTDLSGEVACAGGACEIDFSYAKLEEEGATEKETTLLQS